MAVTLPLESTIRLCKKGDMQIEHTAVVTGELTQPLVEALVAAMGGSVDEAVNQTRPDPAREPVRADLLST